MTSYPQIQLNSIQFNSIQFPTFFLPLTFTSLMILPKPHHHHHHHTQRLLPPLLLLRPTVSRLPTHFIHKPSSLTESLNSYKTFKPQLLLRCQPTSLPYATSTKTNMETNNKDLELSNLFDVKGKVALVTGGGCSFPPISSSMSLR